MTVDDMLAAVRAGKAKLLARKVFQRDELSRALKLVDAIIAHLEAEKARAEQTPEAFDLAFSEPVEETSGGS